METEVLRLLSKGIWTWQGHPILYRLPVTVLLLLVFWFYAFHCIFVLKSPHTNYSNSLLEQISLRYAKPFL
jgi:hypothetical protein